MSKKIRLSVLIGILAVILLACSKLFLDSIYHLPILMYHSVGYTADKSDRMYVTPEAFERQMKFLKDHKYNVIPLKDAVSYIREKKMPPAKTVAITMDDGFENNYQYAYPILKKYNIPATLFVTTDFIGRKSFLNWDEIKEMSASGIIDIESHTKSHPFLTGADDNKLKEELMVSKQVLEKELGKPVRFVCYPMGNYNERVKEAVRNSGYEGGVATRPTRRAPNYDVYEIKRVRISSSANNLFIFMLKVSGYHSFYKARPS